MRTEITDGNNFMMMMIDQAISEELTQAARSYVKEVDGFNQFVIYALNDAGKIIGFRNFFFQSKNTLCRMFSTFVDFDYRKKGVATQLIDESFNRAMSEGCTEFEIRLTQPTLEKDALFNRYCRYAKSMEGDFKFTIYYWDKFERYGYAHP